jgi:hypothetical protein
LTHEVTHPLAAGLRSVGKANAIADCTKSPIHSSFHLTHSLKHAVFRDAGHTEQHLVCLLLLLLFILDLLRQHGLLLLLLWMGSMSSGWQLPA